MAARGLGTPRPRAVDSTELLISRAARIERRIGKIKEALAALGDMRPGSLSVQTRSWGGQYYQLSYTHLGKGRTQYVPPERLEEVKRQLATYRKFRALT